MLRRKNVFERAELTLNWCKTLVGEIPELEIVSIFAHLSKYYYQQYKNELSERDDHL
jgi:hypothetical protein